MKTHITNLLTLMLIMVILLGCCSGCEQENTEQSAQVYETQNIKFKSYENLGGNSGVTAYQIGTDFIRVQFYNGAIYRYTYESAGHVKIERMKRLAKTGQGLNGYINRNVKYDYAERER